LKFNKEFLDKLNYYVNRGLVKYYVLNDNLIILETSRSRKLNKFPIVIENLKSLNKNKIKMLLVRIGGNSMIDTFGYRRKIARVRTRLR